jgi:gluconokinase
VWKQILADVFQKKVSIPEHTESSCLGAVQLGRFAIGESEVLQEVSEETKQYGTVLPDAEHKEVYGELFEIYHSLSKTMESQYKAIHEFQNRVSK